MSNRFCFHALAAASLMWACLPGAQAVQVTDPAGDFSSTLVLPSGVTTADIGYLDVLTAEVIYNTLNSTFTFTAVVNGNIPAVSDALPLNLGSYVWGLNRGGGTERLTPNSPSVGEGVAFDAVVQVRRDGSISVNDLLAPTASTPFAAGTATISGNSFSVTVASSLLAPEAPGNFAPSQYLWNLWPRYGAGNAGITDFAPNESTLNANAGNALVSTVPEASSWAMASVGLLLAGLMRRRKG